jgi:hypothetical protein
MCWPSVGCISGGIAPHIAPLREARICICCPECAVCENRPRRCGLRYHGILDAVLQIPAYPRKCKYLRDAATSECTRRANATQHQQLWCVVTTTSQNDLPPRERNSRNPRSTTISWVRFIQALPIQELDPTAFTVPGAKMIRVAKQSRRTSLLLAPRSAATRCWAARRKSRGELRLACIHPCSGAHCASSARSRARPTLCSNREKV